MPDIDQLFEMWYLGSRHTKPSSPFERALWCELANAFNAGYLSATLAGGVDVTPATPFKPLDHEQTK